MNFLKVGLVVVALAVGAGAFFLERQSNVQLREEVGLLRGEVQQLAKQREKARNDESKAVVTSDLAQSAQQQSDRAEIARLRDEVNALKTRAQEIAQAMKAVAAGGKSPADAIPVKLVPITDWKNAGKATPAATMETVLWAAVGGEVDTLAENLEFTPSAREKATALFDRLSEATRAQYGSPEKLMALMIAKDADKVTGMQILGEREISPGNVGVRIRFGNEMGQTKEDSMLMHRAADGWRLMLTDAPVEKFAKALGAGGGK